jgi:hypothetical protein
MTMDLPNLQTPSSEPTYKFSANRIDPNKGFLSRFLPGDHFLIKVK